MSTTTITKGEVNFHVPAAAKPCKTWYKSFGDIKSSICPLIIVHGGPGMSHDCTLSMTDLATIYNIPTIFYDQIGNGRSTHLPEKKDDPTFFSEDLFISELENLIERLGIGEQYDVLGHSWGGMMASRFASRLPKGLRKLVISNSPESIEKWLEAYADLRSKLPENLKAIIQKHEDEKNYEGEDYERAMEEFLTRHAITSGINEDFEKSLEWIKTDDTVRLAMLGPSEFEVSGTLKDWTVVDDLHKIVVPTLVINGVNEGARDEAIQAFLREIKGVKWEKFHKSTHCPYYEEREKFMKVVSNFLTSP